MVEKSACPTRVQSRVLRVGTKNYPEIFMSKIPAGCPSHEISNHIRVCCACKLFSNEVIVQYIVNMHLCQHHIVDQPLRAASINKSLFPTIFPRFVAHSILFYSIEPSSF